MVLQAHCWQHRRWRSVGHPPAHTHCMHTIQRLDDKKTCKSMCIARGQRTARLTVANCKHGMLSMRSRRFGFSHKCIICIYMHIPHRPAGCMQCLYEKVCRGLTRACQLRPHSTIAWLQAAVFEARPVRAYCRIEVVCTGWIHLQHVLAANGQHQHARVVR